MSTQRYAVALAVALMLAQPEQAAGQIPLGQKPPAPVPKTRVTAVSTLQVAPAATAGRLTIAWGPAAPGAVASYEVYRVGGVAGGATELIATLVRGETSLEQTMPTPGGPVGYQVVANNEDQTRDVSPWVNFAPPPLQLPTLAIQPNYQKPMVSWQESPGLVYQLVKTLQPGVASYPPITVYHWTLPSLGGVKSISDDVVHGGPIADMHAVTHFRLSVDNGRGEASTGKWVAYQPTPHTGVTGAAGSYWILPPRADGRRVVEGCVSWNKVADASGYGLSVIHGSMTQWPAPQSYGPQTGIVRFSVAVLEQGEVVDPVTVRITPSFVVAFDSQHAVDVVLSLVSQPLTTCPWF